MWSSYCSPPSFYILILWLIVFDTKLFWNRVLGDVLWQQSWHAFSCCNRRKLRAQLLQFNISYLSNQPKMACPEIPLKCQPQNLFKIIPFRGLESSFTCSYEIPTFVKTRSPEFVLFPRCQMDVELSPVFSSSSDNFLSLWWCSGSLSVYQVCFSSSSSPRRPTAWHQCGCLGTCFWRMSAVKFGCLNSTTCHPKVEVISTTPFG